VIRTCALEAGNGKSGHLVAITAETRFGSVAIVLRAGAARQARESRWRMSHGGAARFHQIYPRTFSTPMADGRAEGCHHQNWTTWPAWAWTEVWLSPSSARHEGFPIVRTFRDYFE